MSSTFHSHGRLPEPQPSSKTWVDPTGLPNHHHPSRMAGNVPEYVKQLNYNTYMSYGVGEPDSFGYRVGKAVRFVEVNMNRQTDRNERLEATTVAEIEVTKHMLNGAGMLHGGCVAYLIDNCCSTPLVVLGLIQGINGVGVTQSMNVHFHAPATRQGYGTPHSEHFDFTWWEGHVLPLRGQCFEIILVDKGNGRIVASAFMSKMQPASKL